MATLVIPIDVAFGPAYSGLLASVGYTVYDAAGTQRVARTASAAEELDAAGNATTGVYRATPTVDTAWLPVRVVWDITGRAAVVAVETIGESLAFLMAIGYAAQTGDAYGRIGAAGAGLTSLAPASTALSTAVWTNALAGYLPNLNVGGNVASSAEVTAIQNNTRVVRVVPDVVERPDSGSQAYRVELLLYDEVGNMEAPDAAPTIGLVNQAGADLSARLDSTTMALVSTGRYRAVYTASVGDALEQLVWTFSVVEGGATRLYGNTSLIVDTTAADFTAADRTALQGIAADYQQRGVAVTLPVGTGAGQISLAAGLVTLAGVTHTGAVIPTVTTLTSLPAMTADWLTAAGVSAGAVAKIQAGLSTYAGSDTPGTAMLLARLGIPAGASHAADIAAVKADTAAVRVVSDKLGVMVSGTSPNYQWTAFALALAPAGGGGGSGGVVTLAADGLDAVIVDDGLNARQALAQILAGVGGVLSGAGTGTVTVKNPSGTATRAVIDCNQYGNRTRVIPSPPA